jgi:hypothetical protein
MVVDHGLSHCGKNIGMCPRKRILAPKREEVVEKTI